MPRAKVGDIDMEYYVEGAGPPLLMIQGLGGQANSWGEPFLEHLRRHFQVIRFSNRGTGLTDKPQVEYSIGMMADDAAGLLRELGIGRAHVVGISMGGMIAQELALNHAQAVQGLVLGCTSLGGSHGVEAEPEVLASLAPTRGLSPEEQFRKIWPAVVTAEFIDSGRDFLEELMRTELKAPTPVQTLGRQVAAIMRFDTYERLPQIKAHTLIIHGDRDVLVPVANAEVLRGRIAGSRVRILSDAGHCFFWEKPAESAQAIVEFLASVPAPA